MISAILFDLLKPGRLGQNPGLPALRSAGAASRTWLAPDATSLSRLLILSTKVPGGRSWHRPSSLEWLTLGLSLLVCVLISFKAGLIVSMPRNVDLIRISDPIYSIVYLSYHHCGPALQTCRCLPKGTSSLG